MSAALVASPTPPRRQLPDTSRATIDRLCIALERAMESDADMSNSPELRDALTALARDAHAVRMLPEHLVMNLRSVWRNLRRRHPLEDEPDSLWIRVVGRTLDAYEQERG